MYVLVPKNVDVFLGEENYKISDFYGGFLYKPKFTNPLKNSFVTQLFGENKNKLFYKSTGHDGVDYRCKEKTDVFSVTNSRVSNIKDDKSYGKMIVTSHDVFITNGKLVQYIITYCHLSDTLDTKIGDKIECGKLIALSGNSGNSTAPHLHIGCYIAKFGKLEVTDFLNFL